MYYLGVTFYHSFAEHFPSNQVQQNDFAVNKYPLTVASGWIFIKPFKPNDPYRGRTAPLTSKH